MSLTAALNHHLEDVFDMFEMFFDMKKNFKRTTQKQLLRSLTRKAALCLSLPDGLYLIQRQARGNHDFLYRDA